MYTYFPLLRGVSGGSKEREEGRRKRKGSKEPDLFGISRFCYIPPPIYLVLTQILQ